MESSLPEALTSTPLAPVAFVGLDVPNGTKTAGRHSAIWHAFTAERSPDRVPLKVSYTFCCGFKDYLCSYILY